ncbi:MAG: zinc ABC transporter substrate-binding protein [Bacteroidota bacterium]
MKKITLFLFLWLSMIWNMDAQDRPKIAATASMIWDMAKQIAGEHAEINCIVPIGGDPHIYEPTPNDARMVAQADLILKNGLTFEGWLDELIDNSGTKAEIVTVTKDIPAIKSQEYHNAADPHAWMNVRFGLIYIKNIRDALIQLMPEHEADFDRNYLLYKK